MLGYMKQNERKAWGPLIREARTAAGMTQDELAEHAQTTRRTIGSIERGDTVPQRDILQRVLDVLGLSAPAEVESDISAFFALITPLLQRLSLDERTALMPQVIDLIAAALQRSGGNVRVLRPRELSDEDLKVLPSVAHTPKTDQGENEDDQ